MVRSAQCLPEPAAEPAAGSVPVTVQRGLRVVAVLEATKGAIVLLAGFEILMHLHVDAQQLGERIVSHLHLNPANGIGHIFAAAARNLGDARLLGLAAGALAYASMRFTLAFGLWNGRAWAEWFAIATGLLYIPFELNGLFTKGHWSHLVALAVNLAVVAFMAWALARRRAGY